MPTENETFVINPYIAGSPVKDAAMFFGREDVYAWLRQHLRGQYQDNAIVLYGERRAGKTSVLYHMADKLGEDTYIPVLLDLQGMGLEGMDGFLWELARKIVLELRRLKDLPAFDRPNRRDFEENPRHHFEEVFLPPLIEALNPRRLLLMFDETDRLEERVASNDLPSDVFDYLRSLIQGTNHLNFLFGLGNRIEGARMSSQLFNLAVYRKISFLEPDFAEDLITCPVAQHYTYTQPAIERILQLTSGQPYYTQLLCHNLFTRWSDLRPAQLDVADVDAVITDVIEQATPNLQFVWDDSAPVERAILAGLADRSPHYQAGVMRRNLEGALHKAKLYPPPGDTTTGLKRLFERDIINNQEPYEFRVEFLQLWLNKFRRIEWVREELGEVAQEWEQLEQQRRAEAPTPLERVLRWAAPVLGSLLLVAVVVAIVLYQQTQQQTLAYQATTTEQSLTYLATVTELAAMYNANATQAAQGQAELAAASTKVAQAESQGNSQEAINARATAEALQQAVDAIAATSTSVISERATADARIVPPPGAGLIPPPPPPLTSTKMTPPPPLASPPSGPAPRPVAQPNLAAPLKGTIAYPVFNGSTYDIYFGNVATGDTRRYRSEASQPAFNADGSRLAFCSWSLASRGLVTASSNGGGETLITNFLEDKLPTWSPDNKTILFFTRRSGNRASQFYQISPDTAFDRNSPRFVSEGEYPTWGASNQVVFKGWGQTGIGLRLAPPDFASNQTITNSGQDTAPALSPDGRQIVFMSQRDGNWEIYRINVDGSNLQRLTNDPANDGLPTWSPDGRAIAFVSNRNGGWAILVMNANGANLKKLFTMSGSPDGVVYSDQANSTGWLEERISWAP